MTTPMAILLSAGLIALAVVLAGYLAAPGAYHFQSTPNATAGVRINAITGEIRYCALEPDRRGPGAPFRCSE